MAGQQTRREALAAERARPSNRLRALAVTAGITTACAVVGIGAAGGTYALLNTTVSGPGATIQAGTMGLLVNSKASHTFSDVTVNPGAPTSLAFSLTNTGQAKAKVSAAMSTTSTSGLASVMRANIGANPGTCPIVDPAGGTQTVGTATFASLADFAPGETKNFCLYLSIPPQADPSVAGDSLPFTLALTSQQVQ